MNAEDEFCDDHGLWYEDCCPDCVDGRPPLEEAEVVLRARQPKSVKRHICNSSARCGRHEDVSFCSYCGYYPLCQEDGRENKQKRDRKRESRQKERCTCDFCSKKAKKHTLGLCGTHHVRYCKNCSVLGNCPQCAEDASVNKTQPPQLSPCTALVPVTSLHQAPNDTKHCGCVYDGSTEYYCYDHQIWYCDKCSHGTCECPLCHVEECVSDRPEWLPVCACCDDDGVRVKGLTGHCEEHRCYYCKTCYGLCPKCKAKALPARGKVISERSLPAPDPKNYPLLECPYHGWFCSRCDKQCPDCTGQNVRWLIPHCDRHKAHYCPRCGMVCKDCDKKQMMVAEPPEEEGLECPTCGKKALRDCPKHGFYCTACDGNCERCDGCYSKAGVMYHKCSRAMVFCGKHKKHYCDYCGQKCRLCEPKMKLKYHQCGLPKSFCSFHEEYYCRKCDGLCPACMVEKKVATGGKHNHHCGTTMLYCAKHRAYHCPTCDFLSKCRLDCKCRQYYKPTYDDVCDRNSVEERWEEFQFWIENKRELVDCMANFQEEWEDFVKFMFAPMMISGDNPECEEAVEKFMAVESIFKALCDITLKLGAADEEPEEDEDLAGRPEPEEGGYCGWEEDDGVMHYVHHSSCVPAHYPYRVRVKVEEIRGDDLLVPKR
jgi:hypothetical protein